MLLPSDTCLIEIGSGMASMAEKVPPLPRSTRARGIPTVRSGRFWLLGVGLLRKFTTFENS